MPRDRESLMDMLESIRILLGYVDGMTQQQFFADHQCQDAVIRRIEVLGEAANRVSDTVQFRYPHIPWREMRTMRNRVIHGYDTIDLAVVWQTIQLSIPEIAKPLEIVLNDLNNDESCQ